MTKKQEEKQEEKGRHCIACFRSRLVTESISVYRKTLLNDEVTGSCSVCTPCMSNDVAMDCTRSLSPNFEYSKLNISIHIYIV